MLRLAIILSLLTMPALAQTPRSRPTPPQPPQQSGIEQALYERLGGEINANIACNGQLIELRKKVAELEGKLKDQEKK